jgi:hypothetical protein
MRITASLFCLAASLAAAPAFAQGNSAAATAQPLSGAARTGQSAADDKAASQFSFGLGINRGQTERSLLPIGPVAKDQLELKWKPAGNWDVTLDLTSRSQNELFAREEVTAGVGYQVTPRFRLGGGVTVKGDSLASSLSNPAQNFGRDGTEASVRIESAFSF